MASDQVHPLRIAKGSTPKSSPTKVSGGLPRPLSELSPTEKRRNSPSWFQASPKMSALSNDSSPFQSSPVDSGSSPRLFWQNRNSESVPYDGGHSATSPSPQRRSSIERLQRASRVKNSNYLALEQKQEYDPTRIPQIERPLSKVRVNSFERSTSSDEPAPLELDYQLPDFKRSDSASSYSTTMSTPTPADFVAASATPRTTSKDNASPTKSSLSPSKFKDTFDPHTGTWSAHTSYLEDGYDSVRSSRHVKSVTFDAAPPQINEYEMATPDLSSIGTNSREGSYESTDDDDASGLYDLAHTIDPDDSFDAALEDTAKTPVYGPDDWTRDMPTAGQGRTRDRYEASSMPDGTPRMAVPKSANKNIPDQVSSSGDHRPLPPVPGGHNRVKPSDSSFGLPATAERTMHSPHRNLPIPPPATANKSDTQSFGTSKMALEDRLKLMMMSDDGGAKSAAEEQRERRLRRGGGRERTESPRAETNDTENAEADDTLGDISALGNIHLPPKISRESIMRRVNGNKSPERESGYNFSSPAQSPSPRRSPAKSSEGHTIPEDPDIPIPSTEESFIGDTTIQEEGSVIITRNPVEYEDRGDTVEVYEDVQDQPQTLGGSTGKQDSLATRSGDETSQNAASVGAAWPYKGAPELAEAAHSRPLSDELQSFMHSEPAQKGQAVAPPAKRPSTPERHISKPDYDGSGWGEPEDELEEDEPSSPGSVIHHQVEDDDDFEPVESPTIPEQQATIKASGSKLKTRVSNTPADIAAMREARRNVSLEVPHVPAIPHKHKNRLSRDMNSAGAHHGEYIDRHPSFKDRSLTLELETGLSLDRDFERVIEAQKRGYLMRQNTKLVAASDKDAIEEARSTNSSPVKTDRPQSWTVEPWNGTPRRRSTRIRPDMSGPVPPLPGRESSSVMRRSIPEEDMSMETSTLDGVERGRLFVKVMGVKDLDLPLPKNERSWFSLTLDNGVHCVTTSWLELARNAPIGQEFELVVPNDLEFQLTLNVKLEKPAYLQATAKTKSKTSAFSKVFASPKKRREIEQREREEERLAQQQKEAQVRQMNGTPSGYELLSPIVAEDGSFARSYVCLKEHENRCFGRPHMAEVMCFNEWASEEEGFVTSVKSKRGTETLVRRAPYRIGKLELQLLFVPRPKNITDDEMPKSMNSCVRELKAAEERLARSWEGHLSQQGGDCPYWRRRYFKLVGSRLTAYHEATRQPRATINLGNARRLIDDRQALTEKETTVRGGKRRPSAFAEEEEGYMFVEEGFRIRFNNGEVIDFYADTAEDKEGWMRMLSDIIGRSSTGATDDAGTRTRARWCDVVLKHEEQMRRKAETRLCHARSKSAVN